MDRSVLLYLTSSIVNFAIILWLSFELNRLRSWLFAIAAMLPQSVGLFAGIFVDRWKRKRVMIMADSFICFLYADPCLPVLSGCSEARTCIYFAGFAFRWFGLSHAGPCKASVPLLAPVGADPYCRDQSDHSVGL